MKGVTGTLETVCQLHTEIQKLFGVGRHRATVGDSPASHLASIAANLAGPGDLQIEEVLRPSDLGLGSSLYPVE